jgi:flagellar biosynthesis protein FlhF
MEMYIEQGVSRKDCELKIIEKYKRPFSIMREKDIRIGGFLGFFSKPGVQVEFYFAPTPYKSPVTHGYNSMYTPDVSENRHRHTYDLVEEKRKVLAAAGKNYDEIAASGREASQQILDSLKELKEKIESGGKSSQREDHPTFVRAAELLRTNDFSENYIKGMLERLNKELTLEKLGDPEIVQDHLLDWIGESISIYKEDSFSRKPKIMILVGPTGVGKTTTISKLAAFYGIGTDEMSAIDVRMITIDAFRICAKEQLESIGNIMRIPVSYVTDKHALRKEISVYSGIDLFLIDTIGKSPKDASKLGEMKEILEGAGKGAEYHLVISAGTKTSDIENIMRQFEPFNYKSVILTKMDETDRVGNIISALAEKRKSISYITVGQTIPVDIRRASVVHFLINLEGFKINREKIEKRWR